MTHSKKTVIVPMSHSMDVRNAINKAAAWETYDLVIVRDEDYPSAVEKAKELLPHGKRLREIVFTGQGE